MENGRQTYSDLNIPNPTIRDQFLPHFRIIIENDKEIIYKFDGLNTLEKGIGLEVTNGMGYTRAHKKCGKNISKEELTKYLGEMDSLIERNKNDFTKDKLVTLIINYRIKSSLLNRALNVAEEGARKYVELIEDVKKHNESMEKLYERENLTNFDDNSTNKKVANPKNESQNSLTKISKPKRKNLLSRIFNHSLLIQINFS